MTIHVVVTSWLSRHLTLHNYDKNDSYKTVELDLNYDNLVTISKVLVDLNIPVNECGVILLNGSRADEESIISNQCELKLYPQIIGG